MSKVSNKSSAAPSVASWVAFVSVQIGALALAGAVLVAGFYVMMASGKRAGLPYIQLPELSYDFLMGCLGYFGIPWISLMLISGCMAFRPTEDEESNGDATAVE